MLLMLASSFLFNCRFDLNRILNKMKPVIITSLVLFVWLLAADPSQQPNRVAGVWLQGNLTVTNVITGEVSGSLNGLNAYGLLVFTESV